VFRSCYLYCLCTILLYFLHGKCVEMNPHGVSSSLLRNRVHFSSISTDDIAYCRTRPGFHGLDLESEGFIIPIGKLKVCYDSDPLTSPMLGHCMWHELLPCSLAVPLLFFAWACHKKIQLLWWGILFASFCRCDGSTVTIEWNLSAIFGQLLMPWYWSLFA